MPINPNIALGVQPQPQPVNMLGQLGQLYALKAARQEVEGGEAVRDFFSKGGDLSTPEGQRQIMTAAPKLGGQLIKQQADIRKVQIDTLKDEIGLRRDALANVRTPEDYLAWHDANHTGQLGAFFKSAGINPSRESIMAELAKPGGLDRLVRGSALGATKLQQELMQTERTYGAASISAGPQYARLAFDKEKDAREQRQQDEIARILRGEPPAGAGATTPPPAGGGVRVVGAAAPAGGGAPVTGAVTPVAAPATAPNVNALNAGATPTAAGNVNALTQGAVSPQVAQIQTQISQLIRSGTPKSIAVAEALIKEHNILNPAGKLERDANGTLMVIDERSGVAKPVIGKDGKPLASGPAPVWNEKAQVYITPPTPDNPTAKVTEVPELRQIAKKRSALETLDIAGFNKTTGTNEISDLIKQSTSGLTENALAKTAGALFGKGTPGAEAIATLETRANELTLGLAPNGSLGAGFSNDDRTFMLAKLGDVANANKPMNVRLAAWEDVMKRASRNAGIDYKGAGGGGSAPASSGAGVTVSAGGTTYTFPNQDAANKFKQAAGIK